jgi:hypothetical protein
LWPTPTLGDGKSSGSRNTPNSKAHPGISLTDAVRQDGGTGRMWPTPKSEVSGPDYARVNRVGSGGDDLATAVAKMLPSPAARDWRSGRGRKENGHTPQLPEVIGGQLNPTWVAWLMGFPPAWVSSAPLAMPSSRSSRPSSSKRQCEGSP